MVIGMKSHRHEIILDIIQNNSVDTQEMLRELLLKQGIAVTQATLSRDIKELGLIKGQDKYYIPERETNEIPPLLRDSVTEIDNAVNTVVFKCHAGMAMAACATLDRLNYKGIVGTLAGDDTIFILMRSEKEASMFVRQMRRIIFMKKGDTNAP